MPPASGCGRCLGYVYVFLNGTPCSMTMTPLENLDRYMVLFAIACSIYLTLMLLLLACFLRKFSPVRGESLPVYSQVQAVEMRQMTTYTLPRASQTQTTQHHRSHGARSNRSYSSSGTHGHRKRKKILVMRRPDLTQMERLATL